jgi:hypothetical protein
MTKYSALGILACLLAGCTAPPPNGAPAQVAKKQHVYCEPATGSHIADPDNCGNDPFVRHAVITQGNGSPLQTQGDH